MGTSDLPDIYARRPRVRSARGQVRIYQVNHEGACYNCYVTRPLVTFFEVVLHRLSAKQSELGQY